MSSSEQTIHTYHCICTQLVLASTSTLESLKTRTSDSSYILPLPDLSSTSTSFHYALLTNTITDNTATVIRLEDGFEKRYLHKCGRCELNVGYSLDKSQFEDTKASSGVRQDIAFLIPGGLVSTEDMKGGKDMDAMIVNVGVKAT